MNPIKPNYWGLQLIQRRAERRYIFNKWLRRVVVILVLAWLAWW